MPALSLFPDAPEVQVCVGDVWEVGPHRVLCGDAREAGNWARLCGEETVDVVWADPPYGDHIYAGLGGRSSSRRADEIRPIAGDNLRGYGLVDLWVDALRHIPVRRGSSLYFWGTWKRQAEFWSFVYGMNEVPAWRGLCIHDMIVWSKDNMGLCNVKSPRYRRKHEDCYWGSVGEKYEFFGGLDQPDVWNVGRWRGKRPAGHPTPKPMMLAQIALSNSAQPGYIVADPFAGVGTMLDACEERRCAARLMEIDPAYAAACVERAATLTRCAPQLVSTG